MWHFYKSSVTGDTQIGPLDAKALVVEIKAGNIKNNTNVNHPKYTSGNWVPASSVPAINKVKEKIAKAKLEEKAADKQAKLESKAQAKELTAQPELIPARELSQAADPFASSLALPHQNPPPPPIQVNTQVNVDPGGSNSLGIASIILGLLSWPLFFVPFIGLGFATLGCGLAVIGGIMSIKRKGRGIGYVIAGGAIGFLGLIAGGLVTLAVFSAVALSAERVERQAAQIAMDETAVWNPIGTEQVVSELGVTITKVEKGPVEVGSGGSIYKFDKAKKSHLTVWMTVKNHSATKRITFYGWSNDLFGDERQLRDEFDNAYSIEDLDPVGSNTYEEMNPGTTVEHALVFDSPVDASKTLKLKLQDVGDSDEYYHFQFPAQEPSQ